MAHSVEPDQDSQTLELEAALKRVLKANGPMRPSKKAVAKLKIGECCRTHSRTHAVHSKRPHP